MEESCLVTPAEGMAKEELRNRLLEIGVPKSEIGPLGDAYEVVLTEDQRDALKAGGVRVDTLPNAQLSVRYL